jgi:hypothetical protein
MKRCVFVTTKATSSLFTLWMALVTRTVKSLIFIYRRYFMHTTRAPLLEAIIVESV